MVLETRNMNVNLIKKSTLKLERNNNMDTNNASQLIHDSSGMGANVNVKKKKRTNLPSTSVYILKQWLYAHRDNAYPNEGEKQALCNEANLTMNQVSNWFINARRRILLKDDQEMNANSIDEDGPINVSQGRVEFSTRVEAITNLKSNGSKRSKKESRRRQLKNKKPLHFPSNFTRGTSIGLISYKTISSVNTVTVDTLTGLDLLVAVALQDAKYHKD